MSGAVLHGVEVLRVGRWNGVTTDNVPKQQAFTRLDLVTIAHRTRAAAAVAKVLSGSHTGRVCGFASGVLVVNDWLVATLTIDDESYGAILAGDLTFVSHWVVAGEVLEHIALLARGVLPAVLVQRPLSTFCPTTLRRAA